MIYLKYYAIYVSSRIVTEHNKKKYILGELLREISEIYYTVY